MELDCSWANRNYGRALFILARLFLLSILTILLCFHLSILSVLVRSHGPALWDPADIYANVQLYDTGKSCDCFYGMARGRDRAGNQKQLE